MLNSFEHETCLANKSQINNNCKFFLAKHNWAWKFLCWLIWKCQLLLAFSYLLAEKISCLAELSTKKFNNLGANLIWIFRINIVVRRLQTRHSVLKSVPVSEPLALLTWDQEVPGLNPARCSVQLLTIWCFIAQSLSLSPLHINMT